MKRCFVIGCVSAVAVLGNLLAAGDATASHPDILRDYRFIPSRSTLVVNGSSTGAFEETYHARGTFGLVTGYDEYVICTAIGCPPSHVPFAQFVDVDAWLIPDSPLAYVLNLDQTLNLSGLDGTFSNSSPSQLFFTGEDGRGRPFHLRATLHDHLIHLVGESGPGCCNIDHYQFNALAYLRPHPDLTLDGAVDAADFVEWRKMMGQTGNGGSADGDVAVTSADYDLWRSQFGDAVDFSEFADGGANSGGVPEPASVVIGMLGAVLVCLRRPSGAAN
jgi:hypothetical protein